jgi:poly(A) polymerase
MTGTRITGDWIRAPAAQAVCAMLTEAGYQAHFVGGCVRNALIDAPITDLDIATNAHPQTVTSLAENAGFDVVPTGIDHGTVTVIRDKMPFEITTWRRDVETDGRRAVVAYADRIEDDARRRDFTINALYAAPDGTVVDPLGGLADLHARRIRFIEDAGARIREDYLRILRFFRFHAWYGDPDTGLDADALAAISELSAGIETLSRERVGSEMRKLLAAPDPAPAIAAMTQTGVLHHVLAGLDPKALPVLVHFEQLHHANPDPIRRMAVLGGCDHKESFRLSKAEDRQLRTLLDHRGTQASPAALGYRLGADAALDVVLVNAALLETPPDPTVARDIRAGVEATFPVVAGDLIPRYEGAVLGAKLADLEARWIASGFQLTRDELLRDA